MNASLYFLFNDGIYCDCSEHFNYWALNINLLNKTLNGAVEILIHYRMTANIGFGKAFLLPDLNVSDNEFSFPSGSTGFVSESQLQVKVR